MWPFRKKQMPQGVYIDKGGIATLKVLKKAQLHLPGVDIDERGTAAFNLTEEEKQEVDSVFGLFKGYSVHVDHAETIEKGAIAFGLSIYARRQVILSQTESRKEDRQKLLEQSIAAMVKAYSLRQLPIHLYDLACFVEMLGRVDVARNLFKDFLKRQSEYKPQSIDNAVLSNRDIDEAVRDAQAKAR